MWLRSIFWKTLRDYRWAILGLGCGLGLPELVNYATYSQFFGSPFAGASLQQFAQQFTFVGAPIRLDTPGGLTTFRFMGYLPMLLGVWTVLAGARMTRGEEERRAMDILLSTPQSRAWVLGQKTLALATATALIGLLIALGILAGMTSAQVRVDRGGALLAALNVALLAFLFGMVALLLAQFLGRGAAAGWAGGLMAGCYVLDGAGRAAKMAGGVQHLSPFYYYQLSKPLVASYGTNGGALAVLAVVGAVGFALALPLFAGRDIGRTALADVVGARRAQPPATARSSALTLARAQQDVFLRGVGARALRRQGPAMVGWVAALAGGSGVFVLIAKAAERGLAQSLSGSSILQHLFTGTNLTTKNGFLTVSLFSYMPLVVAIFAGVMANRWVTDLDTGRLELVLSTPVPRWRVVLERYAAVLVAAVAAPLFMCLAILLAAQTVGFSLDAGRVAAATFGMLPLELITASLVYALAGVIPPGAVIGLMSAFLGVSFLADLLQTLLKLPDWVLNLSIFQQYGTPLLHDLHWGALVGMLLVALALLLLGVWQFCARSVDQGAFGA
jgi:ABC-2 type transport system permease protein